MITVIQLLIILSGTCALFAVAGIAVKAIERYELMKRQQAFRDDDRVVRIKARVRI